MKIALASPPSPRSLSDSLYWVDTLVKDAAARKAEIICFPESYIPGYPGIGPEIAKPSEAELIAALDRVCQIAAENAIAVIIPMDWHSSRGLLNVAHVVSSTGEVLGYQTKNQLDPSEDNMWVPGVDRDLFEVNGVRFGIVICHEGFRYPESVRWAAQRGCKIVFHPNCTGSNTGGILPTEWGHKNNPYYEKAIMLRAMENTVFLAASNYSFIYPHSASSVIAPDGTCIAHETYGKTGVLVVDIDTKQATGLLAKRLNHDLYI